MGRGHGGVHGLRLSASVRTQYAVPVRFAESKADVLHQIVNIALASAVYAIEVRPVVSICHRLLEQQRKLFRRLFDFCGKAPRHATAHGAPNFLLHVRIEVPVR